MDRLINAARTNGSAAPRASGSAIGVGDLTHPGQRFRLGTYAPRAGRATGSASRNGWVMSAPPLRMMMDDAPS